MGRLSLSTGLKEKVTVALTKTQTRNYYDSPYHKHLVTDRTTSTISRNQW